MVYLQTEKQTEEQQEITAALVEALRAKGIDFRAGHPRHMVHEAVHAIRLGVEQPWTNNRVHEALLGMPGKGDLFLEEIIARAVEGLVMERLGLGWNLEEWAAMSAMEAIRNGGFSAPMDAWVTGIKEWRATAPVEALVVTIFAMAQPPPARSAIADLALRDGAS